MRLTDVDKLVDMLYDNEFASLCPLDEVSGVIDACPTVDAVPVVRCKDCKNWHTTECALDYAMFEPTDDSFCSYGERKEGDTDGS